MNLVFRFRQTCKALSPDCGAPSGWPQVKSWYIIGHDFQIYIDINISLSSSHIIQENSLQFEQKEFHKRLNMTEAYCWKGSFCNFFWFFFWFGPNCLLCLCVCFVETSLMQLQNQLLPYLLKIFQFTARLKKQLFRHSPTQEGIDMFLIFQFLFLFSFSFSLLFCLSPSFLFFVSFYRTRVRSLAMLVTHWLTD